MAAEATAAAVPPPAEEDVGAAMDPKKAAKKAAKEAEKAAKEAEKKAKEEADAKVCCCGASGVHCFS